MFNNPLDVLNVVDKQFYDLGIQPTPMNQLESIDSYMNQSTPDLQGDVPSDGNLAYMVDKYYGQSDSTIEPTVPDQFQSKEDMYQREMVNINSDPNIRPYSSTDDRDIYVSPNTNYEYKRVDEDKSSAVWMGALNFLSSYLATGGDANPQQAIGAGMMGAYSGYKNQEDKQHRFKQIDYLEKKGYNPVDINEYVQVGDRKLLVRNQEKWQSAGNGMLFNNVTGESKMVEGYQPKQGQVKTIDLGNRVGILDNQGNITQYLPKGAAPKMFAPQGQGASGAGTWIPLGNGQVYNNKTMEVRDLGLNTTGGSSQDPDVYQKEDGTWMIKKTNSKGVTDYEVAGPQMQKQLSANAAANIESPTEARMSGDIDIALSGIEKGLGKSFTGPVVGRFEQAGDILSSISDEEEREMYRSIERIDGLMLTQGVGAAKEMGASGINTKAEADMYFKGMPRIDRTSISALKNSLLKIKAYTEQFNTREKVLRGMNASKAQSNTQQEPTTATDYSSKYGF